MASQEHVDRYVSGYITGFYTLRHLQGMIAESHRLAGLCTNGDTSLALAQRVATLTVAIAIITGQEPTH